ncbi:hypothetical protein D3C76_800010 [compost metagenome]
MLADLLITIARACHQRRRGLLRDLLAIGNDVAERFGQQPQFIKALGAGKAQGHLSGLVIALEKILQGLLELG